MYTRYLELHVRPFIGRLKPARSTPRCSTRSTPSCAGVGRTARITRIDHRTRLEHECDERCRLHVCKPLSSTTIRHIHFVLSGAYAKAVRWRWVATNPAALASPPAARRARRPDPDPPTAEQGPDPHRGVARCRLGHPRLAHDDHGAGCGELCALRWNHVDLANGSLTVRRSVEQDGTHRAEKDTKTHQQRRLALDPVTIEVLAEHRERCRERAAALGLDLPGYVFSREPDGSTHLVPSSVTQGYGRLARCLGIDPTCTASGTTRPPSLIAAGVDVRTVAGRLGHGGGGVTTLRV